MSTRIEHDFIGEMNISNDLYYGVQTSRAMHNFHMTGRKLQNYPFFIQAFAQVKKAAALANKEVGVLKPEIADAIASACDKIIAGEFIEQFPVDMIQGGAGTSTNMNVNEVIANIALEILHHEKGEYKFVHPNDHVNLSQSTNDAYPSSIKVAAYGKLTELVQAMEELQSSLLKKSKEFEHVLKMGRTELEDAVPTTLGNTFKAFACYIESSIKQITLARESMTFLNMGATAIGTGINCHPDYKNVFEKKLQEITNINFQAAENFIAATQDTADFVYVSGTIKAAAVRLSKIANDLRLMNSGPRCGLGEINLPKMQPGSSIMPGKVNPVIAEVVGEACYEVIGNDTSITLCAERAEFELNAFEPGIAYALFNSICLLENAMKTLSDKAIKDLTANTKACHDAIMNSISIVTAFNPYIGYEKSSSIAKEALQTGKSIKEICLERKYLSEEEIDNILNPETMLTPHMGVK